MRSRLGARRRTWQYIAMAHRLACGIRRHWSCSFEVLTNSADELESSYRAWRMATRTTESAFLIRQIEFEGGLPASATFHAATNKIYAFRHFASRAGPSMMLDLDVICRAPLPGVIIRRIDSGSPLVLELTEAIEERISRDLQTLAGCEDLFRWFGGEFICGTPSFFDRLYRRVEVMVPTYHALHTQLCHQGDEMLVSAALGAMQQGGEAICDVSNLGVIQRQWFIVSNGDQRRLRNPLPCLLHLPSLKGMLDSRLSDDSIVRISRRVDGLPYWASKKAVRWLNALWMRRLS